MSSLRELAATRTLFLDGAIGSELIKAGLLPEECPETWNVSRAEVLRSLHAGYYEAGSDIVHANTFGANAVRLKKYGAEARIAELISAAVANVKEVKPPGALCAGDMGPTGLMRLGDDKKMLVEMEAAFEQQAALLSEAGVDLIDLETHYDLEEALAGLRACRNVRLPVMAHMTFNRTKRGFFTMMGVSLKAMAQALEKAGAEIVGANCTLGSADMLELCRELRKVTELPISLQPNAGQPRLIDGKATYDQDPERFAGDVCAMVDLGAAVVGGCCGTDASFIRRLTAAVKGRAGA
jgi:5-methyltetrahydrofolate--homocysteine methyltransferase